MSELHATVARLLGSAVDRISSTRGGDINDAYRCELEDGRTVFVKTHPRAHSGTFLREAEGLAWLAEGGARVPEVLAASDEPPLLALCWVDSAPRASGFDAKLGDMLGRMHHASADCFGWSQDNFIGPLTQSNTRCESWADFYGQQRLWPQAEQARRAGALDPSQLRTIERLVSRLDQVCGPHEPPARLHGDLWSGNVMSDAHGCPVLIDPACYGGHREVDLAMLALFGHVSDTLLEAYDAVYPRGPGASERVALYQVYPLLVHANLFGGGYGVQAARAAQRYL